MAIKEIFDARGRGVGYVLDYRVTVDGVQYRKQETLKQVSRRMAEKVMAKRTSEAEEGRVYQRRDRNNPTVKELVVAYLEATTNKKSHRRDQACAAHVLEHLGRKRVKRLVPQTVETYRAKRGDDLTPKGKTPSIATLNRETAFLKRVVSWGYQNRLLDELMLRGVPMLKGETIRDRVISDEEYKLLLSFSPKHLRDVCICAWETGMRQGEIFSIKWGQVDLKNRFIQLDADQTKSSKARLIPISDPLMEVLNSIPRGLPKVNVFLYKGKPIRHQVRRSFDRAKKEAEITDFRFHDFRHCFVTRMRRLGVDQEVIMAITGHATDIMFRRYRSVSKDDLTRSMMLARAQNQDIEINNLETGS